MCIPYLKPISPPWGLDQSFRCFVNFFKHSTHLPADELALLGTPCCSFRLGLRLPWLTIALQTLFANGLSENISQFSRLSFRNYLFQRSFVFNCDRLCIYFFISQFQYMKLIYASFYLDPSRIYHQSTTSYQLAQLVRALQRHSKGQGSNLVKPGFFSGFLFVAS